MRQRGTMGPSDVSRQTSLTSLDAEEEGLCHPYEGDFGDSAAEIPEFFRSPTKVLSSPSVSPLQWIVPDEADTSESELSEGLSMNGLSKAKHLRLRRREKMGRGFNRHSACYSLPVSDFEKRIWERGKRGVWVEEGSRGVGGGGEQGCGWRRGAGVWVEEGSRGVGGGGEQGCGWRRGAGVWVEEGSRGVGGGGEQGCGWRRGAGVWVEEGSRGVVGGGEQGCGWRRGAGVWLEEGSRGVGGGGEQGCGWRRGAGVWVEEGSRGVGGGGEQGCGWRRGAGVWMEEGSRGVGGGGEQGCGWRRGAGVWVEEGSRGVIFVQEIEERIGEGTGLGGAPKSN
ncbi:hypothetical protein ACOMHN_041245 [Nucella lapillus]